MAVDFTILGGGVAGLSMAAEFSKRGASVQVIDPAGPPGQHTCSWWAGGMLAPDCEGALAEPAVVHHGRHAAAWWEAHGADVFHQGTLVVALHRDQSELTTFARRVPAAQAVDPATLESLEPDLKGRFRQALFIPGEAHLDPRMSLTTLLEKLSHKQVTVTASGQATGQVIDCRGLAANADLSDLRGVKGEMVVVHSEDIKLKRPVRLLHPRFPLYIVPRGDGRFMLGATQIESEERDRATVRSVMELLNAAYALHPAFGEAQLLEIGVDARPAFPDNQPRIRQTKERIYANGLFRHGFLLAPALACMTADLVLDGTTPEDWYEDLR